METKLVGISEIAELAGVTRQAVNNWRGRYEDFPNPVQTLQSGPVWNREVIEQWVKQKAGRATQVISFINLKGGVGKTTTAVAVAEVLAKVHRKSVLFIDLDPQTNATINLMKEEEWQKRDEAGQTLAQLFQDRVAATVGQPPRFSLEHSIVRQVSTIDGGISRLDLLPSSIKLINVQEKVSAASFADDYKDPRDILKAALEPAIERYDYIIIDCPPSLGLVTKNGLRISTSYVIPTIPDILSTWGIFQIVDNVHKFAGELRRPIHALGIVATKVQSNSLHERVLGDLKAGRLFDGKKTDLKQPPLFEHRIKQHVKTATGADSDANLRTFRYKYGETYESFEGLTREIIARCNAPKV
ncbi:MAG: AAA family ATPase [Verrucomicrobiota bacterium]|jgi:chromosome partitioning protein